MTHKEKQKRIPYLAGQLLHNKNKQGTGGQKSEFFHSRDLGGFKYILSERQREMATINTENQNTGAKDSLPHSERALDNA